MYRVPQAGLTKPAVAGQFERGVRPHSAASELMPWVLHRSKGRPDWPNSDSWRVGSAGHRSRERVAGPVPHESSSGSPALWSALCWHCAHVLQELLRSLQLAQRVSRLALTSQALAWPLLDRVAKPQRHRRRWSLPLRLRRSRFALGSMLQLAPRYWACRSQFPAWARAEL